MPQKRRDQQLNIRISTENLQALHAAAEHFGLPTSGLIRRVIEAFLSARREHGSAIMWPPRFCTYGQSRPLGLAPEDVIRALKQAFDEVAVPETPNPGDPEGSGTQAKKRARTSRS